MMKERGRPLQLETIIFDFDGTLAHLTIDFAEMRRRVAALFPAFGLEPRLMEGKYILEGIEAGVQSLRERGGEFALFEEEAGETLLALEGEAANESYLLPGIPEALSQLKGRGLRLGIITRNSALAVNRVLSKGHLPYDVLLSREDVGRAQVKPDPAHLQRALQMLKATPQSSLMVGDHPLDIRVAKRVGTYSAGVLTGRHQAHDFEEEGANLVLESVRELPSLFDCHLLEVRS
jgi:phosphoglycolate phosphatase